MAYTKGGGGTISVPCLFEAPIKDDKMGCWCAVSDRAVADGATCALVALGLHLGPRRRGAVAVATPVFCCWCDLKTTQTVLHANGTSFTFPGVFNTRALLGDQLGGAEFSLPGRGGGGSIEPPKTGRGGVREKGSIDRHH